MFVVQRMAAHQKDAPIDVAVGIVTRGERRDYLERTLRAIGTQRGSVTLYVMLWGNGVDVSEYVGCEADWTHSSDHNMGQHIPMNMMLDMASSMNARYFLRVDDDCWPQTPRLWIKRLVELADAHEAQYETPCILAPRVKGLRWQPAAVGEVAVGRKRLNLMEMLGGICRLHPMSLMRYFRWNARLPMGMGEAGSLAEHMRARNIPLLRDVRTIVSHGGSTDDQESKNPEWKAEHDRLQVVPYGL